MHIQGRERRADSKGRMSERFHVCSKGKAKYSSDKCSLYWLAGKKEEKKTHLKDCCTNDVKTVFHLMS